MSSAFDRIIDRRTILNINKWKWFADDVIPLWVADMDFQTPSPILDALHQALEHGILGYELASPSLMELVSERLNRMYGWTAAPETIIAIPGVDAGLWAAAAMICKPGEAVLVQPPVFHHFIDFPGLYNMARQDAPLRRIDHGNTFHYELDRSVFEQAIHQGGTRTAVFMLCNPHNPIGQVYSTDDLEWMSNLCAANGITVFSDDIHNELLLGETHYTPLAALSLETTERTISFVGTGKNFNMSGLGCAFAIIPDPELRTAYHKEIERLSLHVNSLGLAAARAAYSGACDSWQTELCGYLTDNRNFLVNFITQEIPDLRTTVPEATYLAWIDCNQAVLSGRISGLPNEFFLKKAKVALSDGATFGLGGKGFVRLNFACPRSILEESLKRIKHALKTT